MAQGDRPGKKPFDPERADQIKSDIVRGAKYAPFDLIGAPVDIVNMAMGAVGIPVSDKPVMGSEYLIDKYADLGEAVGVTYDRPTGSTEETIGRVVGGLGMEGSLVGIASQFAKAARVKKGQGSELQGTSDAQLKAPPSDVEVLNARSRKVEVEVEDMVSDYNLEDYGLGGPTDFAEDVVLEYQGLLDEGLPQSEALTSALVQSANRVNEAVGDTLISADDLLKDIARRNPDREAFTGLDDLVARRVEGSKSRREMELKAKRARYQASPEAAEVRARAAALEQAAGVTPDMDAAARADAMRVFAEGQQRDAVGVGLPKKPAKPDLKLVKKARGGIADMFRLYS